VTQLGVSLRIRPQIHQPDLEDFFECAFRFNMWGEEKEGRALTHTHTHTPLHLVPITPQRKRPLHCPTLPCPHRNTWTYYAGIESEAKPSVFWYENVPKDGYQASHVLTKSNLSTVIIYIFNI